MYAPREDGRESSQPTTNRVFAEKSNNGSELAAKNVRMHEGMAQKTLHGKIATEAKAVCAERMNEAIKRWNFGNQKDLADTIGCKEETVSRWKKGFAPPKRMSQLLLDFCDLVGIDPWSLWQPQLKITHKPKERLSSPSKQPNQDPLDSKIEYLKMSPAYVMLENVVNELFEQEKARLQKSRS